MAETTDLRLTSEKANRLFAEGVRARNGLRKAISQGNKGDTGYFFGWLDANLTELIKAVPADCKVMCTAEIKAGKPLSGGSDKPDEA